MVIVPRKTVWVEVLLDLDESQELRVEFKRNINMDYRTPQLYLGDVRECLIDQAVIWLENHESRINDVVHDAGIERKSGDGYTGRGASWIRDWNVLQRQFREAMES